LRKIDAHPVMSKAKRMRAEKLMAFNYDNDPLFYEKNFDIVHFNSDDAKPAADDINLNLLDEVNGVQIVPQVFARMYKGLNYELYSQLVKDKTFLRTRVPCCMDCYLLYVGPDDPKQYELDEVVPIRVNSMGNNRNMSPVRDRQSHQMKLKYLSTKYYVSKTFNKTLEQEVKQIEKNHKRKIVSHQGERGLLKNPSDANVLLIKRSAPINRRSASVNEIKRRDKSQDSMKLPTSGIFILLTKMKMIS
jgi:hypothetical protein